MGNMEKFNGIFPPKMRAFMEEYLGDKRGVLPPSGNLLKRTIALDNATNSLELDIQGDFLYADRNTTGVVDVKFNNSAMPAFPFARHSSIKGFPFQRCYLSWAAQSSQTITLWWGYGAEIIPFAQDFLGVFPAPYAAGSLFFTGAVVSNASVQLMGNSPKRARGIIQNHDPANALYLRMNTGPAVADATSRLIPPLGVWDASQGGSIHNNPVTAIRLVVNPAVSVYVEEANSI